jgi:hypothetical protein
MTHRFLHVREQLRDPDQGGQQAGPGVRATHREEGGLADLERVPQPLEEGGHVIFNLAEQLGVAIRVHL